MKRTITLLLALLTVLSFSACGSPSGTENETEPEKKAEATEADTDPHEETIPPQTTQAEESTSVAESEAPAAEEKPLAFDTSWAGNSHVMPIPAPPFKQFEVSTNHYANSCNQYYVYSTDKDEVKALTENDIKQYCTLLTESGFTKIKTELAFNTDHCTFAAATEDGASEVLVDCYMDMGSIVLFAKQNLTQE